MSLYLIFCQQDHYQLKKKKIRHKFVLYKFFLKVTLTYFEQEYFFEIDIFCLKSFLENGSQDVLFSPKTFKVPNKYDAPEKVVGDRKCFDSPIRT